MGTRLEVCDSRWCPLPAPLPHSKIDENSSPYLRQGMVVPVSSSSSPAIAEVPSRGGGSAKAVSKSCSSSGPGESKIEPLIVFDWDDTMLTSSWIQVNELLQAGSYDELPVEAKRDLAHLERSVIECLKNAHQLGTVIIITNAESGWVESAAFAYMMHDHFLDRPRWIQKKVVSIGDSNEEKVAMRIAAGQHSTMAAKAVKFIAGPDPEALACQLDFVTQHLASVVLSDTDVDIVLDASVVNGNYALPVHSRGVYGDLSPSAADQSAERCLDVIVDADVIDVTATAAASANANSTAVAVAAPGSMAARAPTAVAAGAVAATGTVAAAADDEAAAASPPSPTSSSSTVVTTAARTPRGVEEGARAGSSNPIPIPTPVLVPVRIPGGQGARGGGGGGAEGGGDCVQPLLPCQIEVGGSSSSSSLCSAVGVKTEPAAVVSDDAPDGGLGGGAGGAPSEGDGACGGGFACRADGGVGVGGGSGGGGGGEILVEIKLEGGGGVARVVEDGEVSVAAKVLDEAGAGVEEGVKGVPLAAAPGATMVVATATGARGGTAAAREGGSGATDAGVVVTGVVEGGQVVVKPAPMA